MIWTRMLLNKSLVARTLLGALLLVGLSERISADTISLSPGDTLSSSVLNDLLEPIQAPIDYQNFLELGRYLNISVWEVRFLLI